MFCSPECIDGSLQGEGETGCGKNVPVLRGNNAAFTGNSPLTSVAPTDDRRPRADMLKILEILGIAKQPFMKLD